MGCDDPVVLFTPLHQQAKNVMNRSPALDRLAGALFPVALFAFGTLYFGGDLGKYLDDWMLCRRNIETLEIERLTDLNHPGFYRPLSRIVSPLLQTTMWSNDRAIHLILIGLHSLNVLLLWRLLVAIGFGRRTAIAGAVLFAVYPAQHEAVFWSSITATSLATAGFTLLALLQVWIAKRASSTSLWYVVPVMACIAFAVCCLNEQPAMGILALPALSLAVSTVAVSISAVRKWTVAIVPGFVSGLAVLGYLALMVATAPAGERASTEQWTPTSELGPKAWQMVRAVADECLMRDFAAGAMSSGHAAIVESPMTSSAFAAALAITAFMFVRWWIRVGTVRSGSLAAQQPSNHVGLGWRTWTLLFGAGVFALAWVPAWIVWVYTADSRLCYPAAIGLVIACASLVPTGTQREDGISPTGSTAIRAAACLSLIAVSTLFAIMLVGVQRAYRERAEWESRQAAELRALVPDPPSRAVFIVMNAPLQARTLPPTGKYAFDTALVSVWENPWNVHWFLRWHYRRPDLRAVPSDGWPGPSVLNIIEQHVAVSRVPANPARQSRERGGTTVNWRNIIPFVIDGAGRVRLVTKVIVQNTLEGGPDFTVTPPYVERLLTGHHNSLEVTQMQTVVFVRCPVPRVLVTGQSESLPPGPSMPTD